MIPISAQVNCFANGLVFGGKVNPRSRSFKNWKSSERVADMTFFRAQLGRWGMPEGDSALSVTAVVQYTCRRVLELVDGYNLGLTKSEAIAAEIGFSRKIEAQGFVLLQLGRYRHTAISHPQWPSNHPIARLKRSIKKRLGLESLYRALRVRQSYWVLLFSIRNLREGGIWMKQLANAGRPPCLFELPHAG